MNILAIETSCDETAVAVVNGRKVLSNIVASQIDLHRLYGGVVPEMASRAHIESISQLTRQALGTAMLSFDDIQAVAVTYAPGLIGALLTGVSFAKGIALAKGLPIVGVNHIKAHVAANYIEHSELEPPFLALVVSGGHSHLMGVSDYTKFTVIGQTRDDAAGEAFDKVARVLGLPYPGGVALDVLASGGDAQAFEFPRAVVDGFLYDFSFSGLKTSALNIIHNLKQKGEEVPSEDIAASFREAVADVLSSRCVAAAKAHGFNKVVLAGGVAANSRLRELLAQRTLDNSLKLYIPSLSLCGDNAAMVGCQGYFEMLSGNTSDMTLNACATAHF